MKGRQDIRGAGGGEVERNSNHPGTRRRGSRIPFIAWAGVLLAAGGYLHGNNPSPTPTHGAAAARGILRIARSTDPGALDPAKMVMSEDMMLSSLLHLPLLDVTNGLQLVPCGAASWTSSADHRVHAFRLRPGVTFSNGRPVTAADYAYSLERVLSPATAAPLGNVLHGLKGAGAFMQGRTNHVAGITAKGPLELVLELDAGDPMFGYRVAMPLAAPVPREEVERAGVAFGNKPVGNGPYRIQRWRRGVQLRLEPNPYYQGPTPRLLDGVDLMIGGDDALHLMMFERGELDIANIMVVGIPIPSFRRISADPRWKGWIESRPLLGTGFLSLNTEMPPLDNVLVRRAINHAIDRRRRMRIDLGYTRHAEGPIPSGMPAADPGLRGYAYDPSRARELLRESGLPLPLRTALWYQTGEEMKVAAEGFQWDLKQVGIEAELREVTSAQLWSASTTRGQVPITFTGWTAGIPDPVDILGMTLDGTSIDHPPHNNQAFYNNPRVNHLLHEAAAEVSMPRRHQLYREAERLIVADAPWVFLGHYNQYGLRQPWIRGRLLETLVPLRFDRLSIAR